MIFNKVTVGDLKKKNKDIHKVYQKTAKQKYVELTDDVVVFHITLKEDTDEFTDGPGKDN